MTPVLALVLLAGSTPDAVESALRRVLDKPQYRFCHQGNYPLAADEVDWCPLVGGVSSRCPALPTACKAGPAPFLASGKRWRGAFGPGKGSGTGAGGGRTAPGSEDERRVIRLPMLGGLGQLLMWLLLGAVIAAVVYAIAKNFVRSHREQAEPEPESPAQAASAAKAAGGPIETDVERLLLRARAAAARGDYARAVDDAYAALLRRLDGEGLIRIHLARTNGDYVRDLRERPELRAEVRGIVRDVERLQFGAQMPSAAVFDSVFARVVPLAQRSLAALALGLVVLGALSCGGPMWRSRGPWDDSPSGRRAVLEFLGELGVKAQHRLQPLDKIGEAEGALVLLPGVYVGDKTWDRLARWVDDGGLLVLATGEQRLLRKLHLELHETGASTQEARMERKDSPTGHSVVAIPDRRWLSIPASEAEPLLARGGSAYGAWIEKGKGAIMVVADDHLFTNISLAVADNADYLVRVLQQIERSVELCDEMTGASPANPVTSVARGKLAPLMGQLLLFLLIFFAYKGVAFAAPRDPRSASRRAFVEHVRAVGVQYAKARAKRHALTLYAAYGLDRLRERVQLSGRRGLSGLAEAVAAKTGRSETEVMRLLVEAQSTRDVMASSGTVSQEDLSLLRELARLLKETGGVR